MLTEAFFTGELGLDDLTDADFDIERFFDPSLESVDFKLSRAEIISISSISSTRVDFEIRRLPFLVFPFGNASLVKPLGNDGTPDELPVMLDDFLDNDLDLLGDFVNDGVDAKDVSPTIDPDLSPDNFVTSAPSSTKLLDFLESDDGLEADDFLLVNEALVESTLSSSSRVSVEARRRAGGVGDPTAVGKGADADTSIPSPGLLARRDGNLGILSGGLTTDGIFEILLNVLDTVVLLVLFVILLGRS